MLDYATTLTILAFLGVAAGVLGSMLGVGGGIIIAPVLTFMGFPPPQIASTSLFAAISTSASSTTAYAKQKRINYRTSIKLAIPAIPGVVLGVLISHSISFDSFKSYFAILLLATSAYLVFKRSILRENRNNNGGAIVKKRFTGSHRGDIVAYGLSFVAGIISSLFGVGGGIIFVPVMIMIYKFGMYQAAPTSQLSLLITSVAGLLAHGLILYNPELIAKITLVGITLAGGSFAGAQIGARFFGSVKEKKLQDALAVVLVAVAIELIIG